MEINLTPEQYLDMMEFVRENMQRVNSAAAEELGRGGLAVVNRVKLVNIMTEVAISSIGFAFSYLQELTENEQESNDGGGEAGDFKVIM